MLVHGYSFLDPIYNAFDSFPSFPCNIDISDFLPNNILTCVLIFSFFTVVIVFWVSTSIVIQFFTCICCVFIGSFLIYQVFGSPWFFYIIILSIVGGFMVLLSFVIMTMPNFTSFIVENSSRLILPLLLLIIPVILYFILEKGDGIFIFGGINNFSLNKFSMENFISSYPFSNVLMFLAIMILMMLLIIDGIVVTEGGSMLI